MSMPTSARTRAAAILTGAGLLATLVTVAPSLANSDTPTIRAASDDARPVLETIPGEVPDSAPLSEQVLIAASADAIEPAPEPEPVEAAEAAPPEPAPAPEPARSVWDQLADCESGSWTGDGGFVTGSANWGATAGTFEGGLQFHPDTWDGFKDPGMPDAAYQASREQQIAIAERVLDAQGWGAWPVCSRKLGLR